MGKAGLAFYLLVWLATYLFKIAIFEVDISTIKANVRNLHYKSKQASKETNNKQLSRLPPHPHDAV